MISRRVLRMVGAVLYRVQFTALRARLAFVRGRVRHDWLRDRYQLVKPLGGHLYVVRTWKEPRHGRRRKGKRP
jgi:hypothetical protein